MKTVITLAFVLAAVTSFATELKVPGKSKQTMAKSPPPAAQAADPKASCLALVATECEAKNWTKIGKRACIRWKSRSCR